MIYSSSLISAVNTACMYKELINDRNDVSDAVAKFDTTNNYAISGLDFNVEISELWLKGFL